MTDDDRARLNALAKLLELTDPHDWSLIYRTVREDVAAGKMSREAEESFATMVDTALSGLSR